MSDFDSHSTQQSLPKRHKAPMKTPQIYCVLCLVWALVVMIYVIVLELATKHDDVMGVRGSSTRANRFSVLSFVRTGIAIIHTPLITAVLASTIPCQIAATAATHEPRDDKFYDADAVDLSDGVSQLFFSQTAHGQDWFAGWKLQLQAGVGKRSRSYGSISR